MAGVAIFNQLQSRHIFVASPLLNGSPMNRASLVVATVLASTSAAAADGLYFSEAVGGSDVGDELASEISGAVRVKIAVGYRLHTNWAIEAWFAGDIASEGRNSTAPVAERCNDCGDGGGSAYDYDSSSSMASVGVDVKYLRPVAKNLDVYLRGSLGKGWLDNEDYSGRGLGIGAGIQLKGKVPAIGFLFWPLFFTGWGPKVTAALFVDTGADYYRLHKRGDLDNPDSIDGTFHRITVGWAVGADF